MIARRTYPSSSIADLNRIITLNYPMFDVFIPTMIERGIYQVKDDATGRILTPAEAIGLLKQEMYE